MTARSSSSPSPSRSPSFISSSSSSSESGELIAGPQHNPGHKELYVLEGLNIFSGKRNLRGVRYRNKTLLGGVLDGDGLSVHTSVSRIILGFPWHAVVKVPLSVPMHPALQRFLEQLLQSKFGNNCILITDCHSMWDPLIPIAHHPIHICNNHLLVLVYVDHRLVLNVVVVKAALAHGSQLSVGFVDMLGSVATSTELLNRDIKFSTSARETVRR